MECSRACSEAETGEIGEGAEKTSVAERAVSTCPLRQKTSLVSLRHLLLLIKPVLF